jgi:hypothetical protein
VLDRGLLIIYAWRFLGEGSGKSNLNGCHLSCRLVGFKLCSQWCYLKKVDIQKSLHCDFGKVVDPSVN